MLITSFMDVVDSLWKKLLWHWSVSTPAPQKKKVINYHNHYSFATLIQSNLIFLFLFFIFVHFVSLIHEYF